MAAVVSREGEPLDLIVWRNRGRTGGLVEAAFGLNPGKGGPERRGLERLGGGRRPA